MESNPEDAGSLPAERKGPPFHVILHQPEIPANTGNIIRLCGAVGVVLHLVGPLGFRLDAAAVRRAGMDYRELARVERHADWTAYLETHPAGGRLFPVTTHASLTYSRVAYRPGDRFLFGSEGSGLPPALRTAHAATAIRLPMTRGARSLNLANAVAIVLFEALRQNGFSGLE